MKLISYTDLAKMRLRNFVGKDVELEMEESGWVTLVGLGGYEGLGETRFCWRQGEPYQTAGVDVDLGLESLLPQPVAERIIASLGLPIRRGMGVAELVSIFGAPESDKSGKPGARWLRFVCGTSERYLFACGVDDTRGLLEFFLARKDYCDEADSI
jgi:hypothetical protein